MAKSLPQVTDFSAPEFRHYIEAIGEATLLWNDLHEWMALLFGFIMGEGVQNTYLQIWAVLRVDRAKRDILLEAARTNLVDLPDDAQTPRQRMAFESVKWIYDRANELEDDRNNVVHAPLWISPINNQVSPAASRGNRRAMGLEKKKLEEEYDRIRKTAGMLRDYAAEVFHGIGDPKLSWPNTPKLPDRGVTNGPQPRHQWLYVRRTPPPPSSRG